MAAIFNGPIKYYDYPAYGPIKPIDYPTNGGDMPIKFSKQYTKNGYVFTPRVTSDLHLVADDLSGGNWTSRIGTFVAAKTGTPTYDIETPFDTNGLFNGTGRKSVGKFSSAPDYSYKFPYNIDHELKNTGDTTYMGVIKAGVGTATETILSMYDGTYYNLLIQLQYSAGSYFIRAYADHTTAYCEAIVPITPNSYTVFMVSYEGATDTMTVRTSKSVNSSVGSGTIRPATGADLVVGMNTTVSEPMATSEIIEIIRCQELLGNNEFNFYSRKWYGLTADKSIGSPDCSSYVRTSPGIVEVNNKYWLMEENVPRINQNGLLMEKDAVQFMFDSMMNYTFGVLWTAAAFGASTVTANTTDTLINTSMSTQCYDIYTDGSANGAFLSQVSSVIILNSIRCSMGISWRATSSGCRLYYAIRNIASGNYYDPVSKTWGGYSPAYFQTSSTDKIYSHLEFVTDTINGLYELDILNGNDFSNAGSNLLIYSANLMQTESVQLPVYSSNSSLGVLGRDIGADYDKAGNIDYVKGKIKIGVSNPNAYGVTFTTDNALIGAGLDIISMPNGTNDYKATNGVASVTLTDPYSENELIELQCDYNNPGNLVLTNITKVNTGTTTITADIDSGSIIRIGGSVTTVDSHLGYLKYVIIR